MSVEQPWSGDLIVRPGVVLFRGSIGSASTHAHAAVQIYQCSAGQVEVENETGSLVGATRVVIPARARHRVRAMAETAGTTMFLDPSATWAPARGIWVTSMEAWVDAERTAYVIETLELVARSPDQDPESFGRRIEAWLRGRLPASAAIKDFANALSVSEATLRRMARTELGLNVQTYYRWVRLLVAIEGVAAGLSITDAAHAAGFADGSHATRASREMFGLSPSDALAHLHIIKG